MHTNTCGGIITACVAVAAPRTLAEGVGEDTGCPAAGTCNIGTTCLASTVTQWLTGLRSPHKFMLLLLLMILLLGIPHDLDGVPSLRGDTDAPEYKRVKAPVRWAATSVTGAARCIGTASASTRPHVSSAHGRHRAGWVATNHALPSRHSRAYQRKESWGPS